jgi:hypothetical protein
MSDRKKNPGDGTSFNCRQYGKRPKYYARALFFAHRIGTGQRIQPQQEMLLGLTTNGEMIAISMAIAKSCFR